MSRAFDRNVIDLKWIFRRVFFKESLTDIIRSPTINFDEMAGSEFIWVTIICGGSVRVVPIWKPKFCPEILFIVIKTFECPSSEFDESASSMSTRSFVQSRLTDLIF